ncbi:MAG: hypothetical protein P8J55_10365 [Pseudomonadales bacterium]|nr:hypothetical protein [Pseudomonadales bacterium]
MLFNPAIDIPTDSARVDGILVGLYMVSGSADNLLVVSLPGVDKQFDQINLGCVAEVENQK